MFTKILQKQLAQTSRSFSTASTGAPVARTALFSYHKDQMGAKMVEFGGYEMPVRYPAGGVKEHLHCRSSVGLFDVSHMGQTRFKGKDASAFLERMTVCDVQALKPGQASLSLLMLANGGIKDDCIITKLADDDFYVVLNAGCKHTDLAYIRGKLAEEFAGKDVNITYSEENSLIAV